MYTRKLERKAKKLVSKGLIGVGSVKRYITFLLVPKGENDMHMVYDETSCYLNDTLWAPNFYLPTTGTIISNMDD